MSAQSLASIPESVARLFASREERGFTSHSDPGTVARELLDLGLDAPPRDDDGDEVDEEKRPATPPDTSALNQLGACDLGSTVKEMVLACFKTYLSRLEKAEERVAVVESSLAESERSLRDAVEVATRATQAAEGLLERLNEQADAADSAQLKISGGLAMLDKLLAAEVPKESAAASVHDLTERLDKLEAAVGALQTPQVPYVEAPSSSSYPSLLNWPSRSQPAPVESTLSGDDEFEVPVFEAPRSGTWQIPPPPGPEPEAEFEIPVFNVAPAPLPPPSVGSLGSGESGEEEFEIPVFNAPASTRAVYVPPPVEDIEFEVPDFGMFR